MNTKQTVKFEKVLGWMDAPSGAIMAMLGNITDHPRLGNQEWVRTSAVLNVEYDEKRVPLKIETLNTVYVKA